jgi:glyoxylase-like metal-dependent hydrolase (beta-lactamase superfamily II)
MKHLKVFTFNAFQENTYVLWNAKKEAIIVDPGNSNSIENQELTDFIESEGLTPIELLLTHSHIDHVLGVNYIYQTYKLTPRLFLEDAFTYSLAQKSADMYQIPYTAGPQPNYFDTLNGFDYGDLQIKVRFVPGHAKGHVIFINEAENFAIVGDTIFRGSIGRTDLPGGNHDELLEKIQSEIFTLHPDMELHPGHGPHTTVQYEKDNNPFF